jgi:hypothetical protein
MKIKLHEIPVREVVAGYIDSAENGVTGYNGHLNIRPAFQREFIYRDKQRDEVIRTVRKDFPLNVMYWVLSDDGNYEVLDGQQRTISICQYVNGDYSIDHMGFDNLTTSEQEQILNYPLMIYICEGTDKEKLDWFEIVNMVGEQHFGVCLRDKGLSIQNCHDTILLIMQSWTVLLLCVENRTMKLSQKQQGVYYRGERVGKNIRGEHEPNTKQHSRGATNHHA